MSSPAFTANTDRGETEIPSTVIRELAARLGEDPTPSLRNRLLGGSETGDGRAKVVVHEVARVPVDVEVVRGGAGLEGEVQVVRVLADHNVAGGGRHGGVGFGLGAGRRQT